MLPLFFIMPIKQHKSPSDSSILLRNAQPMEVDSIPQSTMGNVYSHRPNSFGTIPISETIIAKPIFQENLDSKVYDGTVFKDVLHLTKIDSESDKLSEETNQNIFGNNDDQNWKLTATCRQFLPEKFLRLKDALDLLDFSMVVKSPKQNPTSFLKLLEDFELDSETSVKKDMNKNHGNKGHQRCLGSDPNNFSFIIKLAKKRVHSALLTKSVHHKNGVLDPFNKYLEAFEKFSVKGVSTFKQAGEEISCAITKLKQLPLKKLEDLVFNCKIDPQLSKFADETRKFLEQQGADTERFIKQCEVKDSRLTITMKMFKDCSKHEESSKQESSEQEEIFRRLILLKEARRMLVTENISLEFEKLQGSQGAFILEVLRGKLSIENRIRLLECGCTATRKIDKNLRNLEKEFEEKLSKKNPEWKKNLDQIIELSGFGRSEANQDSQPDDIRNKDNIYRYDKLANLNKNVDKVRRMIEKIKANPEIQQIMQIELKYINRFLDKYWDPRRRANLLSQENIDKLAKAIGRCRDFLHKQRVRGEKILFRQQLSQQQENIIRDQLGKRTIENLDQPQQPEFEFGNKKCK